MITLNAIEQRLRQFAENHFFIHSYGFGSPDEVDLDKYTAFPLLYVVYTGATYDDNKAYSFEVYVLDRPTEQEAKSENRREVVSDSEQCLEDLVADVTTGFNIFQWDEAYTVEAASVSPIVDARTNVLSGALLDLTISVPYQYESCNIPIDGVQPQGGEISYARRGLLRILTQDGTTDVPSVNTIKVTNGTLTDEGNGVVSIDTGSATIETLNDIGDVNVPEPLDRQALTYDEATGEWIADGVGQVVIPVRNNSPSQTLNKGLIVAFAGTQGDRILVEPWDNASPSAYIVGVLSENLAGGADGHAQTYGEIRALDTSAYSLNTILYASGGGTFTTTANSLPVATVTRVHANTGRIFVRLYVPGDHYRDRFRAEAVAAATAHSVAPAQVETYYTAQANGDGFRQAPGSDTPRNEGDVVRRTIYWKAGAFAAINAGGFTEVALADDSTYAQLLAAIDDILNANGAPITIWSKREEVTPSSAILDGYTADLVGAFALALLVPGYSGACIRVRRSGDNAEQDIGFDGVDVDRAAIAAFCSPGDGFLKVVYNQDGSGNDLTQTTTGNQPKVYDAATGVELLNSQAFANFAGNVYLSAATASDWNFLHNGSNNTVAYVAQYGASAADTAIHPLIATTNTGAGSPGMAVFSSNGSYRLQVRHLTGAAVAVNASAIVSEGSQELYFQTSDADNATAADRAFAYKNSGSDFANNTQTDAPTTADADAPLQVGRFVGSAGNYYLKGGLQALVIWNADKSADRAGIESALNSYFNIY